MNKQDNADYEDAFKTEVLKELARLNKQLYVLNSKLLIQTYSLSFLYGIILFSAVFFF